MSVGIMDSPVIPRPDADIDDVRAFYFKVEHDTAYPPTLKKKTTVIKYTKLPDFDFDTKVCQSLKPRLRRIVELDDPPHLQTSRSFKHGTAPTSKMNPTTKRKIVTISENEENRLTPHLGQISLNRSSGTASNDGKITGHRNTLRSTNSLKSNKEPTVSVKSNNMSSKRDAIATKSPIRSKQTFSSNHTIHDNSRNRTTKYKDQTKVSKKSCTPNPSKVTLSKNLVIPSESEKVLMSIKNELVKDLSHTTSLKRVSEKSRLDSRTSQSNRKNYLLKDISKKTTPVIHVPIERENETKYNKIQNEWSEKAIPVIERYYVDCGTYMDKPSPQKHANVETIPQPTMVNEETETSNTLPTEISQDVFDNLDIPNVTLVKDKSNVAKEEIVSFCSRSLPNLQTPTNKVNPVKKIDDSVCLGKSKTYIIGRATFTYTTKQKINFHVVGSSDDSQSNQSPSPLAYPLNVVSLLKKKLNHCDLSESSEEPLPNETDKPSSCHKNEDEIQAFSRSHVLSNNKLVKPSDLISTITVNNGLLQNDYICEQFQRELHFIDSFFESLQYLESCSLSEKCFTEATSENWVSKTRLDLKNSEYNSFLSKLENSAGALTHVDDIETMASKSLCLLNLLIRDEQRRAKNLLFVLKMREDALKDFTKSQIIWLENKKKQENTDVSTLKKKQRGALLKLQHECGEMQRMRKALLTLSEKRKAALMKTRNNIELKLKNNVDVDQILLGKKKLKRNTAADRNIAPLKCFDLSSSGCDESTSSKPKLESPATFQDLPPASSSAEKCVQTSDSIFEPVVQVDNSTNTADEDFVAVDGGYLNILFQNLSLPQIFSSGKQYEVNEEALKNIVESSNRPHLKELCDSDVVENFMDKIRINRDSDRSSSLSTAHSLVEEFDQYYKGLSDGSKSSVDSPDTENHVPCVAEPQVYEVFESFVQATESEPERGYRYGEVNTETAVTETTAAALSTDILYDQPCLCEDSSDMDCQTVKNSVSISNQTGPLPVPPGAASPEPMASTGSDSQITTSVSTSRSDSQECLISSIPSTHNEEEELRRQQLAIEREIKALEQQQNQLLVVREIPDKPPPPYTPPSIAVSLKTRPFALTDDIEESIHRRVKYGDEFEYDPGDQFAVFIKDVCEESLAKQTLEMSDEPWDACNLLPHKQELTLEKRAENTVADIKQLLSGVPPTVVSGVGARRSDHIDDILFAEWRRCEPEWTALQADEATVKSQVFESLFQKILTETIDQYKQTVLELSAPDPSVLPIKNKSHLGES